jgi:hypothetical protein
MDGFAVLNALTMFASASESGGVWLVQNLTSTASAAQLAPVTAEGSALAPAAADSLAAAVAEAAGGALAAVEPLGLVAAEPHAATTRTTDNISTAHRNRPCKAVMAPPLLRSDPSSQNPGVRVAHAAPSPCHQDQRRRSPVFIS